MDWCSVGYTGAPFFKPLCFSENSRGLRSAFLNTQGSRRGSWIRMQMVWSYSRRSGPAPICRTVVEESLAGWHTDWDDAAKRGVSLTRGNEKMIP